MGQTPDSHAPLAPAGASPLPSALSTPDDDDALVLAGRRFRSRLLVGTGKYKDADETRRALSASGADIVTVALRRVELRPGQPSLLDAGGALPDEGSCVMAASFDTVSVVRVAMPYHAPPPPPPRPWTHLQSFEKVCEVGGLG